jgi:hypothetical protein
MASDTQTRKAGDALILGGEFSGTNMPADADWAGATAEIHIVDKSTLVTEREDPCPITVPNGATAGRYDYIGSPIAEGKYLYEIQVTFVGLDDPLTFPNNGDKFVLKVIQELG